MDEALGLLLGAGDEKIGVVLRVGHHGVGVGAGRGDECRGLVLCLGDQILRPLLRTTDQLIPRVQDVLGVVDLLRQGLPEVIEESEHLRPGHEAVRGHRHAVGLLDGGVELVKGFKYAVHATYGTQQSVLRREDTVRVLQPVHPRT